MAGFLETVDSDGLTLKVRHGFDRRGRQRIKRCAVAALTLARDGCDDLSADAFGRSENNAVGARRRDVDGAGFEGLSAFIRAGESRAIDGVVFAVMCAGIGFGNEQPELLLRCDAIADPEL